MSVSIVKEQGFSCIQPTEMEEGGRSTLGTLPQSNQAVAKG
ncbi:hypothetical protein [Ferrithrix thermotolerans]|nr:hypothetical protein [Ferrithrix thermotolerans]